MFFLPCIPVLKVVFYSMKDHPLSAVGVSFAETYYNDAQYDYKAFFEQLENRIKELKEKKAKDEHDSLERQLLDAQRATADSLLIRAGEWQGDAVMNNS